ncbi:glycosyltransferase [Candidatus Microgenomates bacterium]|nr:glycosyltransferase [Candidatus Microgenomates bacterium]
MKTAVIIIPTYNEADNIERLIKAIMQITDAITSWSFKIVVVDSKSPDKTADIVTSIRKTSPSVYLLETEKEGIGKAYSRGFVYALEKLKPDVLFEMDADFSHDPKSIPQFIKKLESGADFVIGSRYMKGGSIPKDWGIDRKIFSVLGNVIVRLGFMKLSITDWTGGYRAMRADLASQSIKHVDKYTGYVFQIALLDFAVKQHARIAEVPIKFTDRKYGVSKINSGHYIQNIFTYIFNNSSFVKYIMVGGVGFILDFGILYLLYRLAGWPIWLSQLCSAECAILSNFTLNNFWAFSHKREAGIHNFFKNLGKFHGVSMGSLIIQTASITAYEHFWGDTYVFLFKMGVIFLIIIPYSYVLYNRVIWKKKK